MAKKKDESLGLQPVALMEQGAYHAIREWPLFLMLRLRQLQPNLAAIGALPEGDLLPIVPTLPAPQALAKLDIVKMPVPVTAALAESAASSSSDHDELFGGAMAMGFDANELLGIDPTASEIVNDGEAGSFDMRGLKPAWASKKEGQAERNEMVRIADIKRDGGTQVRVNGVDMKIVEQFARLINDKVKMPPIVLFWDGEFNWLADGFHRVAAHEALKLTEIMAVIREGSRRDAIIYSVGVQGNGKQGQRYSRADQRNIVRMLLLDPEVAGWTDNKIAGLAGVDLKTVQGVRDSLKTI